MVRNKSIDRYEQHKRESLKNNKLKSNRLSIYNQFHVITRQRVKRVRNGFQLFKQLRNVWLKKIVTWSEKCMDSMTSGILETTAQTRWSSSACAASPISDMRTNPAGRPYRSVGLRSGQKTDRSAMSLASLAAAFLAARHSTYLQTSSPTPPTSSPPSLSGQGMGLRVHVVVVAEDAHVDLVLDGP